MNALRRLIDQRLQPAYLFLVSGAVLAVGIALAIIAYVTSDKGRTAVGIPFGADFAGFYVAAQILDRGQPEQLYDRGLHAHLYHELLSNTNENEVIPYVHPPFVAGVLRPLTWLRYENAAVVWMLISAALYVAGIVLLLKSTKFFAEVGSAGAQLSEKIGDGRSSTFWLVLLLAFSFEPFLFECWLGGQLSAVGFFAYALAFYFLRHDRPTLAGLGLGLCFYKPTLLLLALPLLLVARRWHVLLGMTMTGLALALLSILLAGWQVNVDYLGVLLSFQKSTDQGELAIRAWKYVDLHHALQQLLGSGSPWQLALFLMLLAIPLAWLISQWWQWAKMEQPRRLLLWAALLTWTPVLNLYVGVYDSILVVQGVLLAIAVISRWGQSTSPLKGSGLAYLLLALYLTPWFSQDVAKATGVSIYGLAIIGLGVFHAVWLRRLRVEPQVAYQGKR
jgi:hypothetical protein